MAKTGAERVRAHRQRQQDEVERLRREAQAHGDCIPVAELAADLRTQSLLSKPESTEGGRRVSVLKRQEGAPVNLG